MIKSKKINKHPFHDEKLNNFCFYTLPLVEPSAFVLTMMTIYNSKRNNSKATFPIKTQQSATIFCLTITQLDKISRKQSAC